LQLLTYLLVLKRLKNLTPAAAFYVKLLRQLEGVKHPDDATAPNDPKFDLKTKPRGILNWAHRQLFDTQLQEGASDVVSLSVTKSGAMHKRCDGCETDQFDALLNRVE